MDWIKTNDQPLSKEDSNGERVILEMYSSNKNETPTYRGTVKLNSGIGRIAFTLIDIDSKKKWVNRLAEHNLIEGDLFSMEYSTYEHYNLAWPVSDREYVLKAKWSIDNNAEGTSAKLEIASTTHKQYPLRNDRVRGNLESLIFHLKEISSETTEVIVEIKVDPKGKLPKFLANQIQKNWPLTTLRALNKEVNQGEEKHKLFL
ncbi:MAG: hypothetical protein MK105_02775 [Crocinitomicaceae bacterium]|nr:hypothetical protein [Crocinitomicaceae bacterium]